MFCSKRHCIASCLGIATIHFRLQYRRPHNLPNILCIAFLNSFLQITSISAHLSQMIRHSTTLQWIDLQVLHQCMCCIAVLCNGAQQQADFFSQFPWVPIGHCSWPQAVHFLHNMLGEYNFVNCYVTFLSCTEIVCFAEFPANSFHHSRKSTCRQPRGCEPLPGLCSPRCPAPPSSPSIQTQPDLCKCTVEKSHTM